VTVAVAATGAILVGLGWRAVSAGRATVWGTMGVLYGVLGLAALASGRVHLSSALSFPAAASVGALSGVALYVATRAFLWVTRHWAAFRRDARELYARQAGRSLIMVLVLAAGLVAVGEELFWRGLVQDLVADESGPRSGALLTWVAYVLANANSRSLPIIAAAAVSGALWGALAWWGGGVLAPLTSHAAWTGLMLAIPPVRPSAAAVAG
jgi:uncharacterized protein